MLIFGQKCCVAPRNFLGKPGPVLNHQAERARKIPNSARRCVSTFRGRRCLFPFVFAAIHADLDAGLGARPREFRPGSLRPALVDLCLHGQRLLIWGGGWFAQHGAVDFSGGYVIHLAARRFRFVAAWVIGPRLSPRREVDAPEQPGDGRLGAASSGSLERLQRRRPLQRRRGRSSAVLNTNLATAVAFLVW